MRCVVERKARRKSVGSRLSVLVCRILGRIWVYLHGGDLALCLTCMLGALVREIVGGLVEVGNARVKVLVGHALGFRCASLGHGAGGNARLFACENERAHSASSWRHRSESPAQRFAEGAVTCGARIALRFQLPAFDKAALALPARSPSSSKPLPSPLSFIGSPRSHYRISRLPLFAIVHTDSTAFSTASTRDEAPH